MNGGFAHFGKRRARACTHAVVAYAACCACATAAAAQAAPLYTGVPLPLVASAGTRAGLQPWTFSTTGGTDLTFTDNVLLTSSGRESDFITTPHAAFNLHGTSLHAGLSAQADMAYDFYANTTRLNGARPRALIAGNVDVIDDMFTIDGRIGTDLRQISQEGRAPATERSFGENQTQVLTYGLTPRFRQHIGDGIKAEARYDFSGVNFLEPPAGTSNIPVADVMRHNVQGSVGSDESTRIVDWTVLGSYEHSQLGRSLRPSQRARGEGQLHYNVSRTFALISRGGFDWIDEPSLNQRPDGPYGLGGFLWRPSPRLEARVEAGYRYRGFNAESEITYHRSDLLNFSLTYMRDIQTTQRLLVIDLSGLTRNDAGNLVDRVTGLPPDLSSLFGLTNQAFKRDTFQVGVNGAFGRNFYNVRGAYERRHANTLAGESWRADALLGRHLTPRLDASAQFSYNKTQGDPASSTQFNSKTTRMTARADYRLGPTVTTGISYNYMQRSTTLVAYRENVAMLSISKVF